MVIDSKIRVIEVLMCTIGTRFIFEYRSERLFVVFILVAQLPFVKKIVVARLGITRA